MLSRTGGGVALGGAPSHFISDKKGMDSAIIQGFVQVQRAVNECFNLRQVPYEVGIILGDTDRRSPRNSRPVKQRDIFCAGHGGRMGRVGGKSFLKTAVLNLKPPKAIISSAEIQTTRARVELRCGLEIGLLQ